MNRNIQAEGTFGGIKWNKGYKRLRRRGLEGVILELGLISCGFNLYKYHLKKLAMKRQLDSVCKLPPRNSKILGGVVGLHFFHTKRLLHNK